MPTTRKLEVINSAPVESIEYTYTSAVTAGDPIYLAGVGAIVAATTIAANTKGTWYKKGRFKASITSAVTISQGDKLYYDVSAGTVRKANDTNLTVGDFYLGRAAEAGSAAGGYVEFDLNEDNTVVEDGFKYLAADLTLTMADSMISVSGNASTVTLTLPAAATSIGKRYGILCTDVSNAVTIDGNASETIEGSATYVFEQANEFVELYCDGTGWLILNKKYNIEGGQIEADAITGAKIADDAIDSEHYTDGSIDTAHLSADCVDGTKIADDAISVEHLDDGILPGYVCRVATVHTWDEGAAAADVATLTGVDATDIILASINVRGTNNPTTVVSVARSGENAVTVTLDQNGENGVTKVSIACFRAVA